MGLNNPIQLPADYTQCVELLLNCGHISMDPTRFAMDKLCNNNTITRPHHCDED